ncbi:MAG: ATP-binding cassette domain-containing protein [Planctomycetes bacterium]|nr:ATP-binding cassette domain-containing protein [Planctomycetota bacterium]
MIEVRNLRKVYPGPVEAVADVSFTARPGEIFGLLGPNGAGKTTTLRILATMLRPTSGTAHVDGIDVCEDPAEVRRRIGFLSSTTGLYERHTPREILETFGLLYGLESEELATRINELLETFTMGPFADRACGLLSTGQRQKTSIARALICDPPILIFDEPTSGLDVLVARTLIEQIDALRDARRTIVLSSHVMPEVERLCDRAAIVHEGRILEQGTLAEINAAAGVDRIEDAFFALIDRATEAAADKAASAADGDA